MLGGVKNRHFSMLCTYSLQTKFYMVYVVRNAVLVSCDLFLLLEVKESFQIVEDFAAQVCQLLRPAFPQHGKPLMMAKLYNLVPCHF